MPIYEYKCINCGDVEEALQKFSDKPLKKCRHCSGKLQKLISNSSFHLKGTGWYVTDYANKSKTSSPPPASSEKTTTKKPDKSKKKTDKTPT
ncbi:MAG: FmdB family zinc ribbon protein [Desulfobacterales bacterium]